eukprot:7614057-Pyramimonas_sp.AAC.1
MVLTKLSSSQSTEALEYLNKFCRLTLTAYIIGRVNPSPLPEFVAHILVALVGHLPVLGSGCWEAPQRCRATSRRP